MYDNNIVFRNVFSAPFNVRFYCRFLIGATIDFYGRCLHHNGPPTPCKIEVNNCELIDFGDKNRVNSSNSNATILKFAEKFDHPFSHVFIFGNMFPASHGFVAVSVTRSNNLVSLH